MTSEPAGGPPDASAVGAAGDPGAGDPGEGAGDRAAEQAAPSAAEEQRRRFREALTRKQGAQHPDDSARGGRAGRGRTSGGGRREFRRKSG